MTIEELINDGKQRVNELHAKMLLADILNVSVLELLTMLDQKIKDFQMIKYQQGLKALENHQPIQYIIGHVNFYGSEFLVNQHVLIPRFETEELVEQTMQYIQQLFAYKSKIKVLDLGCGSGVIGLTLKRYFKDLVDVTLVDISNEALEVAKKNAKNQNLQVTFYQSDWFQNVPIESYDVIISNPPYIKVNEEIDPIVKANEPSLALYGGITGLDAYRIILSQIRPYMATSCIIAFEIGEDQAEDIKEIVYQILTPSAIKVKKDMQGRNRMIFVFC